jgi:hypothetical protein
MTKMEAPYLSVAVCPEPGDDSTFDRVVDLLRERGARPDGDGYFIGTPAGGRLLGRVAARYIVEREGGPYGTQW